MAYDLTVQLTEVPSFKDVKKSGISSLNKGLKRFHF